MTRLLLCFAICAAFLIAGCSSKSGSVSAVIATGPDIVGKWKGKVDMPKSDDPMAKMAEGMTSMFTSNLVLEFQPGDKFKFTMMGLPIEGSVERKGLDLTLTTERAMGMTVEEMKKSNPTFSQEKMFATISADGSKITVKDKDSKPGLGAMVFERMKDEPAKEVASTVAESEKDLVGTYSASMEGERPKTTTEKDEQEFKMAEMMLQTSSLELRADNTFKLVMMIELEGTWKEENGQVKLHMTKMLGMPEGAKESSKNDDMVFKVEPGGRLVTDKDGPKGMKLVYKKK